MSQSQSDIEALFASPLAAQETPLLKILPLEIREKIYNEILPHNSTLHPSVSAIFKRASNHESGKVPFRSHESVLALACTCQVFYTEVIPFYYRAKSFSFPCAYDLYRYLYMIGPHRRQLVQKIDFFLKGDTLGWGLRATKTQEVYEWACELLRECVSLRKLGVGVSVETKEGMEDGPLKGLDALRGMGLKGLEVRVREVWYWPVDFCSGGVFRSVWEIPLVIQPGFYEYHRYFKPEVISALEKRLLQDMTAVKGGDEEAEIETEFHKGVDDLRSAATKSKGKRGAPGVATGGRKKRAKTRMVKKGKSK